MTEYFESYETHCQVGDDPIRQCVFVVYKTAFCLQKFVTVQSQAKFQKTVTKI